MTTLTKEQQAVIASPAAMEIIATEAKKAVAHKFNITVEMVELAYASGQEKVMAMLAELMTRGINEAASLAK